MSESAASFTPMPFPDFIQAVQRDQLQALPLPEVFESPFNTNGDTSCRMPEGIFDARTVSLAHFDGWEPGNRLRGTFSLGVYNLPGADNLLQPQVTATIDNFSYGDADAGWNSRLHPLHTRFNLNGHGELDAQTIATIARLGRLQIVADLTYNAKPSVVPIASSSADKRLVAGSANITSVLAAQRPYGGKASEVNPFTQTIVEGTVSRFYIDEARRSAGLDEAEKSGPGWFEIMVTDPDTHEWRPVKIFWDHSTHHYYSSGWSTGYASYPFAQPAPGDVVQVVCETEPSQYHSPASSEAQLQSVYGGMHLLEPADSQQELILRLETDLAQLSRLVNITDRTGFRNQLGDTIEAHLQYTPGGLIDHMPQTYARRLESLVNLFNTSCVEQGYDGDQCIGWVINRKDATLFQKLYDKDLLRASRWDLMMFAWGVTKGDLPLRSAAPANYGERFFHVLEALHPQAAADAAQKSITTLYDKTLEAFHQNSEQLQNVMHNTSLIVAALEYLPRQSASSASTGAILTLGHKVFGGTEDHPLNQALHLPVVEALCASLQKCATWKSPASRAVADIQGVGERQTLSTLRQGLPRLLGRAQEYYQTLAINEGPDKTSLYAATIERVIYMRAVLQNLSERLDVDAA